MRTLLRGRTVFRRGAPDVVSAERGQGVFIPSGRPDLLGWKGEWPTTDDLVQKHATALLGPSLDGIVVPAEEDEDVQPDESHKRARTA